MRGPPIGLPAAGKRIRVVHCSDRWFGPKAVSESFFLQTQYGGLRALATASRDRIEPLPDVPTIAEAGFKDYEAEGTLGVVAPAKTPKETVSQLANWFTAAMEVSEVKAKLLVQGLHPIGTCGPDFGTLLRKQYDEYGRVIREGNMKAE